MSTIFKALPLLSCFALASPAMAQGDLCLTGDFDAFLARFSHEIILQEAATADPLALGQLDPTAEPEPAIINSLIPLADVTWPVMPDTAILDGMGLVMEISETEAGEKAVLLRGTDNGIRSTWFFAPSPCWTLVRMLDESM